jgi:hypothetical protein
MDDGQRRKWLRSQIGADLTRAELERLARVDALLRLAAREPRVRPSPR